MSRSSNVRVSRSNREFFLLPLFIILIFLAILAALVAFVWQMAQDANPNYAPPLPPTSTPILELPSSSSQATSSESSSSQPSSEEVQVGKVVFGKPLPQSARVTSEYFNDAVFIGDSITTGLELYDILPQSNVVASTGINLESIVSAQVIDTPSGKQTVLQAAKAYSPKKIYIMLGANGLNFLSSEQTVELYSNFVDKVVEQHPNATIYIQSILPIEEELFAQKYPGTLSNEKIDACNALLMKMAGEKHLYYLDVAEAFKDETGGMPKEATSDGLHFKSAYYTKWTDYLKTHIVTED